MGIVHNGRAALLLAAGLAIATPAAAQFGNRSGPGSRWNEGQVHARNQGYREGFERGDEDRRARQSFNYTDERSYRNGDGGYQRAFGDRETYRRAFRAAYVDGYGAGYYGRGTTYGNNRYPGRFPYPGRYPGYPAQGRYPGYRIGIDIARQNGFEDGYDKGLDDGQDSDRFDPTRHGWYRSGTRGYRGQFGSKDFYRNEYRVAFREGYERGYRESQAYRTGRGRRW
jgi:hypothetical protein